VDRHTGRGLFIRLNEQDMKLLETLAKHYGITKTDVIRIAIKEYAKRVEVRV
jgi:predicted DNA-binding protein